MACFSHINQSGPKGMYQGRFGSYEVSVRNRPESMKTEVIMCFQGMCAGQEFDEYGLSKLHHSHRGSMREHVFELVARLLEQKIEENRHESMMRVSYDPAEAMYPPSHNADAVRRQANEAHMRQGLYAAERRARMEAEAVRAPPMVNINIDTSHKPKRKFAGTLRQQLQAETNEWLKEVRAA